MNVVGICGFAGAGRDAELDSFFSKRGYTPMGLADALKRLVFVLYGDAGISKEMLWGYGERRNSSIYYSSLIHYRARRRINASKIMSVLTESSGCKSLDAILCFDEVFAPLIDARMGSQDLVQILGKEWAEGMHEDIWFDVLMQDLQQLKDTESCYGYDRVRGLYKPDSGSAEVVQKVVITDVAKASHTHRLHTFGADVVWVDSRYSIEKIGSNIDHFIAMSSGEKK